MNSWKNDALLLLMKSLSPIPMEINELDWKSDISTNTERLAHHISAFANYPNGGFIVFGIDNNGKPSPLVKDQMDLIVQKIGNIARNNLAQPIGIEHAVVNFNDKPVLFIYIPEHNEKPVYLRSGDVFDSYGRSAGQTVKLSRNEVKMLISESFGLSFESQIALRDIPETEVLKLLDVETFYGLQKIKPPFNEGSLMQSLADDDILVHIGKNCNITNLGAVLLARKLDDFKELKRKSVRVIQYKKNNRIDAIKEQIGGKGYAIGFEGLIEYIMSLLPSNEVIEKALRTEVSLYPEVAIREFVANSLIHQDFSVTGAGVMIEIFSDRIEITNPGVPLVDTNRFIDTAPKSRNEMLAALMRRMHICEERGSGIDRAIESIEFFQLPAPKFIRGDDYTRIILYAPIPLSKMDKEDRIRACYQHTCLHYVSNQKVNNLSVRKRFNISKNNYPMASKIITETIEAGLIKISDHSSNSKKFASYLPFWA